VSAPNSSQLLPTPNANHSKQYSRADGMAPPPWSTYHHTIAGPLDTFAERHTMTHMHKMAEQQLLCLVVKVTRAQTTQWLLGDHQHMRVGYRGHVSKGHRPLVLVDHLDRDFLAHDLREQ
jgi:hypothetical protein